LKRLITWLVGAPLALIAILLSVANRAPVKFSLDPFSLGEPALEFETPLYVLLFAAVFFGMAIGWAVNMGTRLVRRGAAKGLKAGSGHRDGTVSSAPASGKALFPRS
jgi:uncharacterized integral membrane protein